MDERRCFLTDRRNRQFVRFKRLVAALTVGIAASFSTWYEIEHDVLKKGYETMTPPKAQPKSDPCMQTVEWLGFTERVCHG